jgi:hypothetical protein
MLAKSAIAKAELAASEVASMPAGTHAVLDQTRRAVQRRAGCLLTQLQEPEDEVTIKVFDEEAASNETVSQSEA